jgi:tetratricopeptide (TPR) repeat protein
VVAEADALESGRPASDAGRDFREVNRTFVGSWSGFERDRVWINPEQGDRFFDAAYVLGLDFEDDGRAIAPLDFDGDGDLDLAFLSLQGLRLMENRSSRRSFSRIRLNATRTPPLALGAVAAVRTGTVSQRDFVRITDGFLTQVSPDLHFGLGDAGRIDEIRVAWPSGKTETWTDLPCDRLLVLTEGESNARVSELPSWPASPRPDRVRLRGDRSMQTVGGTSRAVCAQGASTVLAFLRTPDSSGLSALATLEARATGCRVAAAFIPPQDPEAVRALADAAGFRGDLFAASEDDLSLMFGAPSQAPSGATFVFDSHGGLCRAILRAAEITEIEEVLGSLRDEPVSPADLIFQGEAHLTRGDSKFAVPLLKKAVLLDPDDPRSQFAYAFALISVGRQPEALAPLQRGVALDPDYSSEAWFNLGSLLRGQGDPGAAAGAFRRALKLRPADPGYLVGLSAALAESGQLAKALEAADEAVRVAPRHAEAHFARAAILVRAGRPQDAAEALRATLRIDPSHADAHALAKQLGHSR